MARSFFLLIEMKEFVIQQAGEGDPGEVGQHEDSGEAIERPEADGGDDNGDPEQDDDDERCQKLVGGEENACPDEVEGELDVEEDEGFPAVAGDRSDGGDAPDEPRSDGHEAVEDGPDRSEDPVGWVEAGFDEGGVPGGDGRCGEDGADGRDGIAEEQEEDQCQPGGRVTCCRGCGRHDSLLLVSS